MNDFISAVRTDRWRELMEKEKSGIQIADKYYYKLVDSIKIKISDDIMLTYGFQANQKDVYFFITNNGANSYFSIVELYELLKYMCDLGDEDIVLDVLDRIMTTETKRIIDTVESKEKWENRTDFYYRDVVYHFKAIDYPEYDGLIKLDDGAVKMSYLQIFVLLNLIQEKSNAFFTRGESKHVELVNGIVRLFICLLNGSNDYEELKQLGWFYDSESKKYNLNIKKDRDKERRKYYLTEDEYLSIINAES